MSEPTQAPIPHYLECGAPSVNSLSCWEMLGMLLAWEYDGPELRAERQPLLRQWAMTIADVNLPHGLMKIKNLIG